ncbi:MAG TPA: AbrB family transcriptional regulator [Nocardioidaceae bacterium]|jgi:membrane AbrB-like protein|nr:AbrB family transcriptional regulator [Nocardioidaceae bacterium]
MCPRALSLREPPTLPRPAFTLGQAVVGVTIGAMVSPPALQRLVSDVASVLLVTLGTLVISVAAGRLLALRRDVSLATGAFALVAGGASGVVALAHQLGADDRVVTVVQYLRVLLVLLAMPLVTAVVFHPPAGAGGPAAVTGRVSGVLGDVVSGTPAGVIYVVLALAVGLAVARWTPLPAGTLLGPLLAAVLLTAADLLRVPAVPTLLADAGYALVGLQVGLRFTRASLRSIARLLPAAAGLIVAVIAACAGLGALLSWVTGVDPLTAYLATTPGGLYAVLATAADSGSDVTYVLAVQVIRVFAMLLAAPLLGRLLGRWQARHAVVPRD